jgi:hypothetical protein
VFGDLNFRITLDYYQTVQACRQNRIDYLLQYDELTCLKNAQRSNYLNSSIPLYKDL